MFKRALLGVETWESGKKCWVNVHDPVMIVVDELGAEDSKVAREGDETVLRSNTVSLQGGDSLAIILGVHFRQSPVVKDDRLHEMFLGYLKRSNTWLVTDDNIHFALCDVAPVDSFQDRL